MLDTITQTAGTMKFEGALGDLNQSYFFREFTYSTNTFKPDQRTELELADAVVWLEDFLIVIQAKERYASFGATAEDEENWFNKEVQGKAVTQIGNTLKYLRTYDSIELANNQGHKFDLADAKGKRIHKLVVYHPNDNLPPHCGSERFQMVDGIGAVHILRSEDYHGILQSLITPVEVEEYLAYRELLIEKWGNLVNAVSEQALVGHFLRNLPDLPPSPVFIEWLEELRQKSANNDEWDIARIIHLFNERRNTLQKSPVDYYGILKELARLNRVGMEAFKKRFFLAMKAANEDRTVLPYRFQASTGCSFLFIPLGREHLAKRDALLSNLTELNKYDLKIDRCIGLTFVSEGNGTWCDVRWCRIQHPWKHNDKYSAALKENYPFRPVKAAVIERYGFE